MNQMQNRHNRLARNTIIKLVVLMASLLFIDESIAQTLPENISVLPVFVVPDGQKGPSNSEQRLLMRHLQWTQERYQEMLDGQSTFDIEDKPMVFESKRTIKQFEDDGNAANLLVGELLDSLKVSRFSCKYVFLAVFVNRERNFPRGGGRPINGGYNTGGGIVVFSTEALHSVNFQSSLQHELGHSFGLPHVNSYRYDMKRNESIMSYNPSHHTNKFSPSKTPGVLIPEDIRGFSFNDRVFKNLEFDEDRDVPRDYVLKGVGHLPAMDLPGHPLIKVETKDGEEFKSSVSNIVHSRILHSSEVGYYEKTMWCSARQQDGVASVSLTFPTSISLDRIEVYSEHSGKSHRVTGVTVSTVDKNGNLSEVGRSKISEADDEVRFKESTSQEWKLDFRAGKSKMVVLRGLRFFKGEQEFFAPLVPYKYER
ncbi:MAG: hypothetical protein AAFN77_18745 [Planctomycetota bacterium]